MTEPLQPGESIGPYGVAAELGRGGMGAVYRAVHRELGHQVALKVILPDDAADEEARARFQREAVAAARLRDEPGIVGVRDYGDDAGRLWFAMPLLDGRTLEDEIDAGDLPIDRAVTLIAAAARAVHRAHGHGVIHRDLKPPNILIDAGDTVWVNDFGLARLTAVGDDAELTRLTQSGFFVGTPHYMAPEQIHGAGLDGRADVYGLGAALYDALTGRPPFEGATLAVTLTLVMRMDPAPPSKANPGVPPALDAIVLRSMSKAPSDRYQTALALAEDLERFLSGQTVSATQAGLLTAARKSADRHRGAWLAGAVVAAAAAAAGGAGWWFSEQEGDTQAAITDTTARRTQEEEAQRLSDVWAELNHTTADPIRRLQDRLFGVAVSGEEVDLALAAVQAATATVGAQYPDSALPAAWYGLALVYADRASKGIQQIDQAMRESDDPLCDVVLARAHCARFLSQLEPPGMTISKAQVISYEDGLTAEMKQDLHSARQILEQAKEHPLWAKLGPTTAVVRYERALHTLLTPDAKPDSAQLKPLQDEPLLADETALLEGFAFFRANDPRGAADAWIRPSHRRWPGAMRHAVVALLITGLMESRPATERLDALEQAQKVLAVFDLDTLPPVEVSKHHSDVGLLHWIHSETLPIGDPRVAGLLDQAAAAFDKAEQALPGHVPALTNAAIIWQMRARQPGATNADAVRWLRKALALMDRVAARPNPNESDHVRAATARIDLSRRLSAMGTDPRPLLGQAVAGFDAALGLPHANRGTLLTLKASALHELGKAIAARGGSPMLTYAQAATIFKKRFALGQVSRLGRVHAANLANSMAMATRDPAKKEQYLMQAQAGASDVLTVMPDDTEALQLRALVRRNLALLATALRRDPLPLLRGAEEDYGRAIDSEPGLPPVWSGRGFARYRMGIVTAASGGDGAPLLESAISDFDAALERAPTFAKAMHGRAMCRVALAELEALKKRDPLPFWDAALKDCDAAAALAPRDPLLRFFRGKAYYDRALAKIARRVDPAPDLRVGLAEFEAAAALQPRDWRGPFLQGMCLDKLGRSGEALAKMEAAAKLDPRQPMVQRGLQQLRAAAQRKKDG